MPEFASRILLAVEAIIICLPLSALFLITWPPSVLYSVANTDGLTMAATCLVIILPTLCSAWVLILTFVFHGNSSLQCLPIYWWVLPFLSSGLAVAAIAQVSFATALEPSALNLFGWGVPLLIPLVHLCFERWFRPGAKALPIN
jgi:hypothetical protein